ncbi:MAG TPA: STAS domain-containing protein [Burkholderiaceae bacterium]|nr:STAS domain-containing protein [Burkholderiaceae bacterium]
MHALPATLTLAEAKAAAEAIARAAGEGEGPLQVDARGLHAFDTSAIAVLIEGRRCALAAGRAFRVHAAPAAMVELAGLYGVGDLLAFEAPRP